MKRKPFFVILFLSILALPLLACLLLGQARLVVKPEAVSQVDELLAQMNRDSTFSGSALIAQDGVVYLSKGYGLADRLQGIPNTPQTRFHLGSMTKQFTAMAILILQSQGKLSVQDTICNYITDCPKEWQDITIHHLLTHTSGMFNYFAHPDFSSKISTIRSVKDALPLIYDQKLLFDTPGERFSYSNSGIVTLGAVIEAVTGQSYPDYIQENILKPLGMNDTHINYL